MRYLIAVLLIQCLIPVNGLGQLQASFPGLLKQEMPKVIEWRRYFHQFPELSKQEFKTAAKVAELLRSWGLEVQTGLAPAHHTPEFILDESGFETGVNAFCQLVFDFNKK